MKILGITGGFKHVYESSNGDYHDAAAVLLVDGKVVAAIEEERLVRIKHTDKFPVNAIKFVLAQGGITLNDLDYVCFNGINLALQSSTGESARVKIADLLSEETGIKIDSSKIHFVHHHLAHAASAYYMSGETESLVFTVDGQGDEMSGMVLGAKSGKFTTLKQFPVDKSLGIYYLDIIRVIGYRQFDEYKVMGLAPYGNPAVYRELFRTFYNLLPDGDYSINHKQIRKCYGLIPERKKGEDFTTAHKDIAAALQESLEEIIMHVLNYFKQRYNYKTLCLSGGVAHNCSVNGKLLYAGMFRKIFVQPASHDAGCALGAALFRYYEMNKNAACPDQLDSVYWGTEIPGSAALEVILKRWSSLVGYEKVADAPAYAAQLISGGAVIGWVQGRSEFGPRALGNRSIIADPRPGENKDRINQMVKMREGYRPFAPSVLEEYAHEIYELPAGQKEFPFMTFVLSTQERHRAALGAVTHIDGTARVQTVSKKTNEKYWQLIHEFYKLTGMPVLLNTSFNNNAEPVVDSVDDAVSCFLTTGLDCLVIGDYVIRKKEYNYTAFEALLISMPRHNTLTRTRKYVSYTEKAEVCTVQNNFDNGYSAGMSGPVFEIVTNADEQHTVGQLMDQLGIDSADTRKKIVDELKELWAGRFIALYPLSTTTS